MSACDAVVQHTRIATAVAYFVCVIVLYYAGRGIWLLVKLVRQMRKS